MLRILVLGAVVALGTQWAQACTCFSPKLRAESAQRLLREATFALHARVIAVSSSGEGTLLVMESFKGPPKGAEVKIPASSEHCNVVRFTVGEEALITAFGGKVGGCDKYSAPESFVLDAYRRAKRA